MTWVDDIDKSVAALQTQIQKLKVKAEDNIPSVMKLNKITSPSIYNKHIQSKFKIGSSYYERDPDTIEQVDSKLLQLRTQAANDKALVEKEALSNVEAISNNKKVVEKITQIMTDLGIPRQWSKSYFKTANSRKQTTETTTAGYLGDLSRNVPTSDDSSVKLNQIKTTVESIERYAETLKQKIRQAQNEKDKAEKAKKEFLAKARLQVKYSLSEHSDWYDVLDSLDKKDKYFMLARAGEETRGNWSERFGKVENALDKFIVLTEEDKEIDQEYEEILDQHNQGDCEDGRVFRDCEFNYSVLYAKVDQDLMTDYETLKEYYEVY